MQLQPVDGRQKKEWGMNEHNEHLRQPVIHESPDFRDQSSLGIFRRELLRAGARAGGADRLLDPRSQNRSTPDGQHGAGCPESGSYADGQGRSGQTRGPADGQGTAGGQGSAGDARSDCPAARQSRGAGSSGSPVRSAFSPSHRWRRLRSPRRFPVPGSIPT